MPAPTKGARLGGSAAHQKIILANLATQLFEHGRITTTEAKARRLRPLAEKLITKAKRGDIHSRRLVLTTVKDKGVVHVLFTEIAPTFADREGGYTRITKVGPRKGDNAPMALIELVTESVEDSKKANARSATAGPQGPGQEDGGQDGGCRPGGQRDGGGSSGRGTGHRHRRAGRVDQRAGDAERRHRPPRRRPPVETPADPEPTDKALIRTPERRSTFGWAPFLRSRSSTQWPLSPSPKSRPMARFRSRIAPTSSESRPMASSCGCRIEQPFTSHMGLRPPSSLSARPAESLPCC